MTVTAGHVAIPTAPISFPVGYHRIHPDVSMNFQMNRWYGWAGETEMLQERRTVAPRIVSYADWIREFVSLAERAAERGHVLRSGAYWRAAEFFMRTDDPERQNARDQFFRAVRSVYPAALSARHAVPYVDGRLRGVVPVYRLEPSRAKGTILLFGGFDSYVEELTSAFILLRDAGYDVIAFDGPGQGSALYDGGLRMTPEWQKPVGAVLDYFAIQRATLIGLSLGGCLALRAAAREPRIDRVVGYDVFANGLDVATRQLAALPRAILSALLRGGAASIVNTMLSRVERTSPVVEWGLQQGMHVTGTASPFDFLTAFSRFGTADVSASITQDVLLLAGSADHYVPLEQWYSQIHMLSNARSITARLFTSADSAENHCQVGNAGLAWRTIVSWLDEMVGPEHQLMRTPVRT